MNNAAQPRTNRASKKYSEAMAPDAGTTLARAIATEEAANPGKSGFRILQTGTDSLKCRMAIVQAAEKTLDLQYYTIHNDTSANLLLQAIVMAAKRNVRVRFLIDNISMKEVGDSLSVLNTIDNIEVRVFNPLTTLDQSLVSKVTSIVSGLTKATKRMHNKAMMADNVMAIIGGRNLGDEYFDAHADENFKDTDILTAGQVTLKISDSFDTYWNSDDSLMIDTVHEPVKSPEKIAKVLDGLKTHWDEKLATKDGAKTLQPNLTEKLKKGEVKLVWAEAEVAADKPGKINQDAMDATSNPLNHMEKLLAEAHKEFIVVSPYFVPQEEGIELLRGLTGRGVRVRVLTNSLASTDVVAVHTGYKRYRETVLESGVQLYELKAIDGERPRQRLFGSKSPSHASLHAKIYVIDRSKVVIGSFNFDPRSISLNTEIAMIIHSPEIAAQVVKMFEEATSLQTSYRLEFTNTGDGRALSWVTEKDHKLTRFSSDPEAGFWRNAEEMLMQILPIENQL